MNQVKLTIQLYLLIFFVLGNSKQLKGKYFNDGYVESDFVDKPPTFFANLLSGGKLQSEWDSKQEAVRKSLVKNKKK